jgi:hypothetical protein
MKLRVPDMAHDSVGERPRDIGLLRSGAGNCEEKAITKAPKTRKHEHALVQHQSFYGQGRCIEVEEQPDSKTRRPEVGSKLCVVHIPVLKDLQTDDPWLVGTPFVLSCFRAFVIQESLFLRDR